MKRTEALTETEIVVLDLVVILSTFFFASSRLSKVLMNTSTVLLQTNKKVSAESSVPRPWFYNMPPFCFPTRQ